MLVILLSFWSMVGFAQVGVYSEKGVRDSLAGLVRAFEDQDIDAVRLSMTEEFLDGNPEIIGRVRDSFERFEMTRLTYRVGSIQVADGIVALRLNWTKTSTDRMNDWTYRDIGNDVVMYFSALPPYQLVGLQEPNLFGVSFLLQTRIVITAPAMAKLDLDRRRLELEEQRLALEQARLEDSRRQEEEEARRRDLDEREARMRSLAQQERLSHQLLEDALPATAAPPASLETSVPETGPAITEQTAPAPSSAQPVPVAEDPYRAADLPPGPPPSQEPEPPAVLPPSPRSPAKEPAEALPEALPEDDHAQTAPVSEEVRRRAEAEAMQLLARRRQFIDLEQSAPVSLPSPPVVDSPPGLEDWRREMLRELRQTPSAEPVAVSTGAPELVAAAADLDEARERARERARRLDEARAEPAPPSASVPSSAEDLRRIEQAAKIGAEVRDRADEEAVNLLRQRARFPLPQAETQPDVPREPEYLRRLREEASVRALTGQVERADAPALPSTDEVRRPDDYDDEEEDDDEVVAPVEDEEQPGEYPAVVEILVADPARAVSPSVTSDDPSAAEFVMPPMCAVTGGEQQDGPDYGFHMSRYEVTNEEFCRFLNAMHNSAGAQNIYFDAEGNVFMNESLEPMGKLFSMTNMDFEGVQSGIIYQDGAYYTVAGRERHPVVGVSWYGALKYCNWLTMAAGMSAADICYHEGGSPHDWRPINISEQDWVNGFSNQARREWLERHGGFRLPMNNFNSTAGAFNEFYLAAAWNGERNTLYGFGRDQVTGADANYQGSGYPVPAGTTPVGFYNGSDHATGFQTNPNGNAHGIHDLSGNVWEWGNDTTGHIDYRALYGGSWRSDSDSIKTSYRGSISPHHTADHVGFRVVSMRFPGAE